MRPGEISEEHYAWLAVMLTAMCYRVVKLRERLFSHGYGEADPLMGMLRQATVRLYAAAHHAHERAGKAATTGPPPLSVLTPFVR